jgi:hypothetical protein
MSPSSSPVFDTSSVGCGRASPKLCIVHPEKRLPVPLPRPTSETIISPQQSVRPSPGEVLPTAVRPLPKPRISRLVNIPILSTPVAGQTDRKNLTEKPDDVTNNKILMGIEATPSTEQVTVGTVGSSQSDSVCGVVSTVKKLNPTLELELEQFVMVAKKSALKPSTSDVVLPGLSDVDSLLQQNSVVKLRKPSEEPLKNTEQPLVSHQAVQQNIWTVPPPSIDSSGTINVGVSNIYSLEMPVDEAPATANMYEVIGESMVKSGCSQNESNQLPSVPVLGSSSCLSESYVYEDIDRMVNIPDGGSDSCKICSSPKSWSPDRLSCASLSFPSPGFAPPPLPHVASTPLRSAAGRTVSSLDTSSNSGNKTTDSFIEFVHERAQQKQPIKQLTDNNNFLLEGDVLMSPVSAGFAEALDSYFSQNARSPEDWLNQRTSMAETFSPVAANLDLLVDIGSQDVPAVLTQKLKTDTDQLEYVMPSGSDSRASVYVIPRQFSTTSEASIYVIQPLSSTTSETTSMWCKPLSPPADIVQCGVNERDNNEVDDSSTREELFNKAPSGGSSKVPPSVSAYSPLQTCCRTDNHHVVVGKELRGYLSRVGTGLRSELVRRWCVITNGILSCYDSDKSIIAKETFECQEMISVTVVTDCRYANTFELHSIRRSQNSVNIRSVQFTADNVTECNMWINVLSKNMTSLLHCDAPWRSVGELKRGGIVFMRTSAAADWQRRWIHLTDKTLFIFGENSDEVSEIDLRKTKAVRYMQQTTDRCPQVTDDNSSPFAVYLHTGRTIWMQADVQQETESWHSVLQSAMLGAGNSLSSQPLTADNVPIIVDKCINFVTIQGMETEGIYRLSGQHSKVSELLKSCQDDVRSVLIKAEDYQIHDVTNALKRFFRTLDEPILTSSLYASWIAAAGLRDTEAKLESYKVCLSQLPAVNYATVKRLIVHLSRVAQKVSSNKMSVLNLASVFGPIMLKLDSECQPPSDYGKTNLEIGIVKDFLENHQWLFEVDDKELEQEQKIEEALKRIEQLKVNRTDSPITPSTDLLISVYILSTEGEVTTMKVPPSMLAAELVSCLLKKNPLHCAHSNWAVFEVVAGKELERPLHWSDNVIQMTMKWSCWPIEICRDNCLCLKQNVVYEGINLAAFNMNEALYCEFFYAALGKKTFRRYYFEFTSGIISMRRDTRAANVVASWNASDLVVYIGIQQQRNPPARYGFTFYDKTDKLIGPFLGHCICCNTELELYQWLGAVLHSQYPEGLQQSSTSLVNVPSSDPSLNTVFNYWPQPASSTTAASSSEPPSNKFRNLTNKFQKLVKRDK